VILPLLGSTRRFMHLIRVDFPAPLGPMIAMKSSAWTSKSIPFKISGPLAEYLTRRSLTQSTVMPSLQKWPCLPKLNRQGLNGILLSSVFCCFQVSDNIIVRIRHCYEFAGVHIFKILPTFVVIA